MGLISLVKYLNNIGYNVSLDDTEEGDRRIYVYARGYITRYKRLTAEEHLIIENLMPINMEYAVVRIQGKRILWVDDIIGGCI